MRLFILTLLLLPGCGPDVDLGAEMTGADVNAEAETINNLFDASVDAPPDAYETASERWMVAAAHGRAASAREYRGRFEEELHSNRHTAYFLAYTAGAVEQCLRAKETK